MIRKLSFQILVVASLAAALLLIPASAKADDKPTQEAKSGLFIKPSSGLDIKPDSNERKKPSIWSSRHLPLSDDIDIGFDFEKPQKQDITDKKRSTDRRALLGIILRF